MKQKKAFTVEFPMPVGTTVFDRDFPLYPQTLIGYRIGSISGEEEFADEHGMDEPYMELSGCGISSSCLLSEFEKSIFLTREEAKRAADKSGLQEKFGDEL